jgi:hypothetical protein
MELHNLLYGWTKDRTFWFVGLVLVTLLAIFASLNIGVGKPVMMQGKVTAVGLETATRYELPILLVTIQLKNGNVVTVEAPRDLAVNTDDSVVLVKSNRLLTSGAEYQLQKVLK